MLTKLCTYAAACSLYSLTSFGCLTATAAVSRHLSYVGCVSEANLALIDHAYCINRR